MRCDFGLDAREEADPALEINQTLMFPAPPGP